MQIRIYNPVQEKAMQLPAILNHLQIFKHYIFFLKAKKGKATLNLRLSFFLTGAFLVSLEVIVYKNQEKPL